MRLLRVVFDSFEKLFVLLTDGMRVWFAATVVSQEEECGSGMVAVIQEAGNRVKLKADRNSRRSLESGRS